MSVGGGGDGGVGFGGPRTGNSSGKCPGNSSGLCGSPGSRTGGGISGRGFPGGVSWGGGVGCPGGIGGSCGWSDIVSLPLSAATRQPTALSKRCSYCNHARRAVIRVSRPLCARQFQRWCCRVLLVSLGSGFR